MHTKKEAPKVASIESLEKTIKEDATLFHTMATERGVIHTYKMFNTKTIKESLSNSDKIWNELELLIKKFKAI